MKIYYMGNEIRSTRKKYPKAIKHGKYSKTRFQLFMQKIRKTVAKVLHITKLVLYGLAGASTVIAVGMIIYSLGGRFHPRIVEAAPVTKEVKVVEEISIPVLERIAQCESGKRQFDKNGQVVIKVNENKTVDSGYFQINLFYWGKQAKLLGYDLSKEADNKAFGKWLFLNYGSAPWSASAKCWSN